MLLNKELNRWYSQCNVSLRLLIALSLLSLLTSCTTTSIPGLDRILFPSSSAKVGPIVTADEQYPQADEIEQEASSADQTMPESVAVGSIEQNKATAPSQTQDTSPKPAQANKTKPIQSNKTSGAVASETADRKPSLTASKPQKVSSTSKVEPKSARLESTKPVAATVATVQKSKAKVTSVGAVSGSVVLLGGNGQKLSATGTMVTLTPKALESSSIKRRAPKTHVIDMEDKQYQPRYSTINAGDQVVFVNKDNIRHNVFSSSGSNAFDLGTYGAGLKRAVTLEEPGIVKIYCNIHSDMATFVAVGNQSLSTKADDQGRYQIGNVPPGTYELGLWNIRGESKQVIEVKANQTVKLVDRIDTVAFKLESHKNKFGGNYSKNSALFEDEFY